MSEERNDHMPLWVWQSCAILWLLIACLISPAHAAYQPGAIVAPSTATVASITGGHWGPAYPTLHVGGFGADADGGDGDFAYKATSCAAYGPYCIQDLDGNFYLRTYINGSFQQIGVTNGSIYDITTNPTSAVSASSLIQSAITALNTAGIYAMSTGQVSFLLGTTITIPGQMSIDCGIPMGAPVKNGHYAGRPGTIVLAHSAFLSFTANNDSPGMGNCTILPQWYVDPTHVSDFSGYAFNFPPVSQNDFEYMRGNMIKADDKAISINAAKGGVFQNLTILGFDNCIRSTSSDHQIIKDILGDCNIGDYAGSGGGNSKRDNFVVDSLLARQVQNGSGTNVGNENIYTITAIAASPTNNVYGRPECRITLGPMDATVHAAYPGTDLHTSALNSVNDPITFPMWLSNFTPTATALTCAGNGPQGITVISSDATTAVLDLNGSEIGTGANKVAFTGRWDSGSTVIGIVSGNTNALQRGEVIAGTGIAGGSKVLAVCASCKGPDPNDPYIGEIYLDTATTGAATTDTAFTADGGAFVAGADCDGGSNGYCAFINGAERVYAGESLEADIASSKLPLSNGHFYAVGHFSNDSVGYESIGCFTYAHHYNYVMFSSPNFVLDICHADDNGELDDTGRAAFYAVENSKGNFQGNGIGKTGRSQTVDLYALNDVSATTTLNQASIPAGLSTIVVVDTSTFGSANDIRTISICQTTQVVDGDTVCVAPEEHITAEIVDGTHFKLLARGQFFSAPVSYLTGATIFKAAISNDTGSVAFSNLTSPSEQSNSVSFELAHGSVRETSVYVSGDQRYGIVSGNTASNIFTATQESAVTILYENAAALYTMSGCGNIFATIQRWNVCGQNSFGQNGAGISVPADTTEDTLVTATIPANTLGGNGCIDVDLLVAMTGSTNSKTVRAYYGSTGTTPFLSFATATVGVTGVRLKSEMCNANNTQLQIGGITAGGLGTGGTIVTGSVDSTLDKTVIITGQKASSGETLTVKQYRINASPAQ